AVERHLRQGPFLPSGMHYFSVVFCFSCDERLRFHWISLSLSKQINENALVLRRRHAVDSGIRSAGSPLQVIEKRVENANVRNAIYGKVVPSGCSPNGFRRWRVADAVAFLSIITHV